MIFVYFLLTVEYSIFFFGKDIKMNYFEESNKLIIGKEKFVAAAIEQNRSIVSVLRTKGGSGESHAVNAVLNEIFCKHKSALVVHEFENGCFDHYKRSAGAFESGSNPPMSVLCSCCEFIERFVDSFFATEISKQDAIVFTQGTSAGVIMQNIRDMLEVSELVILTVNSNVFASVDHAYSNAEKLVSDCDDVEKIRILCWLEPEFISGNMIYKYKIYNLIDFIYNVKNNDFNDLFLEESTSSGGLGRLLFNKLRIFKG